MAWTRAFEGRRAFLPPAFRIHFRDTALRSEYPYASESRTEGGAVPDPLMLVPPLDRPCDLGGLRDGLHVLWEVTAGCNLACLHCSVPRSKPVRRLSPERSLEVLDGLVEAGVRRLSLTGGEPLLRKDLWALAGRAVEHGLEVEILTNGMLLEDDDVAAALAAENGSGRLGLVVSLDAGRDWVHDGLRGRRGAHAAALAGIRRALGAGLEVRVQAVLCRRNRHEVEPLVDLARSLNHRDITFRKLVVDEGGRGSPSDLALSPDEQGQIVDLIRDLRERRGDALTIRTVGLVVPPDRRACAAGRSVFGIDSGGYLQPCSLLRVAQHASRDLQRKPVGEVLERPTLSRLASPLRPGCA
jgi:MoaA/NifB/PqqE/SkfB family radical SAM enzyme